MVIMEYKSLIAKETWRTAVRDAPISQSTIQAAVPRLRCRTKEITAAVTAAVSFILVMASYGFAELEPMFALSSMTWSKQPGLVEKGTPVVGVKPRVAFIVVFRGIHTPITQEQIDAMYEGLRPTPDLRERVEVLDPQDIKSAIMGKGLRPEQRSALLQLISADLGAAGVLFVDVCGRETGFDVVGEFVDALTGTVVHKETVEVPGQAQLVAGMHGWLSLIP